MQRLFIAAELPDAVIDRLVGLAPRGDGVRPVPASHMHLTLHFLGPSDLDAVRAALPRVPPMTLHLRGVGRFTGAGGDAVLWAGIEHNPVLLDVHAAIGEALRPTGFVPESRPYSPHITLARCRAPVDRDLVDRFLAEHAGFEEPAVPVEAITVFSSVIGSGPPIYTREHVVRP